MFEKQISFYYEMASPRHSAIDKCGFGGLLFKKFDSQSEASPSPEERVPYPAFSDGIYYWLGDFGHVLFKELLCNKFFTPKERVTNSSKWAN